MIVIHFDVDAFYAQVEQVRLGLSRETPVVCQQWNGIIAVNYSAKSFGVTRGMNIQEAKKVCPLLVPCHVATYLAGDLEPQYHADAKKGTHKVSLQPYRDASLKIMQILQSSGSMIEQASIDEAYLDVTEQASMNNEPFGSEEETIDPLDWYDTNIIGGIESLDTAHDLGEYRKACEIAYKLRTRIKDELGYTLSAGISNSKPLAKLASSIFKPFRQTLVHPSQISLFLQDISISKIGSLGGKRGEALQDILGITKCGQLPTVSSSVLEKISSTELDLIRGICTAQVLPPTPPKSISAQKNFTNPISDNLPKWVRTIAAELHDRIHRDHFFHRRYPQLISLSFTLKSGVKTNAQNVNFKLGITRESFANQIMELNCNQREVIVIALSAGQFQVQQARIDNWLVVGAKPLLDSNSTVEMKTKKPVETVKKRKVGAMDAWLGENSKSKCGGPWTCERCGQSLEQGESVKEHDEMHQAMDMSLLTQ